jgi:hypothetical protein
LYNRWRLLAPHLEINGQWKKFVIGNESELPSRTKTRDITKWWLVMMLNLKLVHIRKITAEEVPEMNQATAKQ